MKSTVIIILALFSLGAFAGKAVLTPLEVVNTRITSYNNHDIDAFLKTYSDDIQIYTYPNVPLGKKGKEHLRSIFQPMFTEGKVSVKIHQQIVQGNYVINHETVAYAGKETKYVSIYEVKGNLITSVQFVRE